MGLTAMIYKRNGKGDSSNGGLSARVDEITLVNVDGPSEPTPERPAALLVDGNLPGTAKIVPLVAGDGDPEGRTVGAMFGGCYVACSDSRFYEAVEQIVGTRFDGAVPLHDRFETPAQNAQLSA